MYEPRQDVFISHAGADKLKYIRPLTEALATHDVTFWLDEIEVSWGDTIVGKINDGLRASKFALVCLSENFLSRPWPEAEMSAVLAIQNNNQVKQVLPLILNSREEVFNRYPLLAGLAYREFEKLGPDKIAEEIATLTQREDKVQNEVDSVSVTVEGVHTGKLCRLRSSKRATVKWLAAKAQSGLEVKDALPAGPFTEFRVRWVLVDVEAEEEWEALPRGSKREIHAIVATEVGIKCAFSNRDRLEDLGIKNDTVFHLYAIEDEDYSPPPAAAPPRKVPRKPRYPKVLETWHSLMGVLTCPICSREIEGELQFFISELTHALSFSDPHHRELLEKLVESLRIRERHYLKREDVYIFELDQIIVKLIDDDVIEAILSHHLRILSPKLDGLQCARRYNR